MRHARWREVRLVSHTLRIITQSHPRAAKTALAGVDGISAVALLVPGNTIQSNTMFHLMALLGGDDTWGAIFAVLAAVTAVSLWLEVQLADLERAGVVAHRRGADYQPVESLAWAVWQAHAILYAGIGVSLVLGNPHGWFAWVMLWLAVVAQWVVVRVSRHRRSAGAGEPDGE